MKPLKSVADYAAIAVAPLLIFLMISSLANFLMLILYHGGFPQRVSWTLLMFTLGAVGIARVAIEKDRTYSLVYAALLGAVTFIAMSRFANSPIFSVFILIVIAYLADVIVRDCTLIDEEIDVSGQGLIDSGRLFVKNKVRSDPSDAGETRDAETDDGTTIPSEKNDGKKVRQPGRTVMYLALGALPLFGVGQFFLRNSPDIWARAQALLAFYLFASLSLLVTTSFLSLRRYLRQRRVEMPKDVSVAWLGGGLTMIALVLGIAFLAPMPGTALATLELPAFIDSPGTTMASRFGWGDEGADQGNPSDAKTSQDRSAQKKKPSGSGPSQPEGSESQPKPGGESQRGAPAGEAANGNRQQGPAGNQSGGKQSGGKQSDSKQSGGKQSGGKQSDSKQSGGKQSGGKQSSKKQSGGKQSGGKQSAKQSGGQQSGEKQSGGESRKEKQQGAKNSSKKQSEKSSSPNQPGQPPQGEQPAGKQPGEKQSANKQPGDQQSSENKPGPQGKQNQNKQKNDSQQPPNNQTQAPNKDASTEPHAEAPKSEKSKSRSNQHQNQADAPSQSKQPPSDPQGGESSSNDSQSPSESDPNEADSETDSMDSSSEDESDSDRQQKQDSEQEPSAEQRQDANRDANRDTEEETRSEQESQAQPDGLPPEGAVASEDTAASRPADSEPGMMESIADSLPGLSSMLRFVIFVVLAGIVGGFLWLNRHLIATWWAQRRRTPSGQAGESIDNFVHGLNQAPPRAFSSFRNPVGQESDLRKIVVITFQAFEAWTREQGAPRDKDETPSEFVRRVCHRSPQFAAPAQQVVEAYNRIAYGRGDATPHDVSAAQQVWSLMQPS